MLSVPENSNCSACFSDVKLSITANLHQGQCRPLRYALRHRTGQVCCRTCRSCSTGKPMKIGVAVYYLLSEHQSATTRALDLFTCAGDFRAVHNAANQRSVTCPPKYRDMWSFHHFSGHSRAAPTPTPTPTIFVLGIYDMSHDLQELAFGVLVVPDMYFLRNAGAPSFHHLCVAGVNGTYVPYACTPERTERQP